MSCGMRCDPKCISDIVKELNENQKKAIGEIGLGSFLNMTLGHLFKHELDEWLMDRFDPETMYLVIDHEKKLIVDSHAVSSMFALPQGNIEVPITNEKVYDSQFREKLGIANKKSHPHIKYKVRVDLIHGGRADNLFVHCFILIVLSKLLLCTRYFHIQAKYVRAVEDVSKIKHMGGGRKWSTIKGSLEEFGTTQGRKEEGIFLLCQVQHSCCRYTWTSKTTAAAFVAPSSFAGTSLAQGIGLFPKLADKIDELSATLNEQQRAQLFGVLRTYNEQLEGYMRLVNNLQNTLVSQVVNIYIRPSTANVARSAPAAPQASKASILGLDLYCASSQPGGYTKSLFASRRLRLPDTSTSDQHPNAPPTATSASTATVATGTPTLLLLLTLVPEFPAAMVTMLLV